MNNQELKEKLLKLIKENTKPAIGCTEPVAVAFATATGKKHLDKDEKIKNIYIRLCLNIYKNGKSVIIPNTNRSGLDLAAVLGIICGNADDGLAVFKNVNQRYLDEANEILANKIVTIEPIITKEDIFVEVDLLGEKNKVNVILNGGHTHITKITVNENVIFEDSPQTNSDVSCDFLKNLSFKKIRELTEEIKADELKFILDGVKLNKQAAQEGLKKKEGLRWGASLLKMQKEKKLIGDVPLKARILTAAGADIRMGGGTCPIMTSGGSGNQGLGVIIPITVVAENIKSSKEKLARAIFFGHAINNFVKIYTGKLSSMCGCAIAAGIGASAGIAWLLGGNDQQIEGAVQNMLANITGMICDGAKESCALKLSTSSSEAVLAAYLACDNVFVPNEIGIIGNTVEETIKNIGFLCKNGLAGTDKTLFEIINR